MTRPVGAGDGVRDQGGRPEESVFPFINAILRWRMLTIVAPLVLAALVGIVSLSMGRRYVAQASFVPQESGPSRGSLGAIAAQLGMSQLSSMVGSTTSASPQFYNDLLHSRELLRAAVTDTYTVAHPKPFKGTLVQYFNIRGDDETESALKAIRRFEETMLATSVDRNTGIVHLTVTSKSRELSEQLARRMLDLVNDFNLRRRQSQVGAEAAFTERRTTEALQDLRKAEGDLSAFHTRNRQFEQSPELRTAEAGLQRQVTMAQQIYITLAQQYEMAKVEAVRTTPVITILDSPERLVEPQPRRTVQKVLLTFVLGAVVGTLIAFSLERMERLRETDPAGYSKLQSLLGRFRRSEDARVGG